MLSSCGKSPRIEDCVGKFLLVETVSPELYQVPRPQSDDLASSSHPADEGEDNAERFFVIKPGGSVEFHNLRWEDVREKSESDAKTNPMPSAGEWWVEPEDKTLMDWRKGKYICVYLDASKRYEGFLFGGYMVREQNGLQFWIPVGDPDLFLFIKYQKVAEDKP